ncbi:hypothetical protein [Streptomyces sp. N35]|uniref:hypothetical protein n=1 Tax=Streptomyces sp. N35 TaxID=2795730 RepID=UPI0018F72EB8|nr:hypothetical protein [Streptomyces sp. N35]
MTTRNDLYALIDELPDEQLEAARDHLMELAARPYDGMTSTPQWRTGEAKADREIATGQGTVFPDADALFAGFDIAEEAASKRVLPSPDEVEAAKTPAGAWTKAQLAAWGVPWPAPKGWKQRLAKEWKARPHSH